MNTFSLKVIASDKVFFDGKCGIIIVPALDGEQAIMSHHEDMVIAYERARYGLRKKRRMTGPRPWSVWAVSTFLITV